MSSSPPGSGSQDDLVRSGSLDGQGKSICFDFTKGLCTRGDKCKYSHDLATIVNFNSKEKGTYAQRTHGGFSRASAAL